MPADPGRTTTSHGPDPLAHDAAAAIDVEGFSWRPYGRREPVIDGLDLHVDAGQRVLLVGPSGSGKSTLLRAVAGVLETADAGERAGTIRVGAGDPMPGTVGLVLQDPGAGVVAATVGRDVAFGLENRCIPREHMPPIVARALHDVGLAGLHDAPTGSLSGGQSQRMALAGCLALDPRVLLLDEPLAMLDPATASEVVAAVVSATTDPATTGPAATGPGATVARRRTLVVVEHRLEPWLAHVDRLVVLDARGRITVDGPPREVVREERERLLDLGVWVPGEPAPEPACGLDMPCRPGSLDADHVTVDRVTQPPNRPPRVVRAVSDISLHVGAGSSLALVGPSGSGKSSLLLALAGLEQTQPAGHDAAVRVTGEDPRTVELVPEHVAWVPQSPAAGLVARTVGEEVGASGAPAERVDALLDAIGMAHLAHAQTASLSGGEQRRLAVAAAVAAQPRVLLTDEMTIGQDRHTWAAVVGLAESLQRAGSAVVHATHDPLLVARADAVHELPVGADVLTTDGAPLASRAGPLALVLACAVAVGVSLSVATWRDAAAGLAVEVVLGAVALIGAPSLRALRWRLLPMLVGAAGLAWSSWLLGGHQLDVAATAAGRLLVAVLPSAILLPLVDPDELGDHLAQRLHAPARPVVALAAALHRLQDMADLRVTAVRARRMRGLPTGPRALPGIAFGVLVDVLGSAACLAVAMDARGFAIAHRRTWARAAPWTRADTVVVLLGLVPWAVVVAARAWG